jgi:hypothetical protein
MKLQKNDVIHVLEFSFLQMEKENNNLLAHQTFEKCKTSHQ